MWENTWPNIGNNPNEEIQVNDEDQIPYKKPRKRRKPTILPLDLTQTYTTIKPNKIKGDISGIIV